MFCQQQRIFAPTDRRVIIFPATDFVKTRAIIAINGHDIAGSHFEQHGLRLMLARLVDQKFDELATVTPALMGTCNRQVKHVTFITDDTDNRMTDRGLLLDANPAVISNAYAIAEYALSPGEFIYIEFNFHDLFEVVQRHAAKL